MEQSKKESLSWEVIFWNKIYVQPIIKGSVW